MRLERVDVERFHAQTHVIHVSPCAGRTVFRAIELRAHLQQVDQRTARAQLRETQLALLLLEAATEHLAVEARHDLDIRRPNHHVVDLANMDFHLERFLWPAYGTDEPPVYE